ncbi:uncharacterized protein N7484_004894 [Penicillium longicatenatum]|uniref:uncharacterized protein n=1 Tax=Penicillium longicatenatum TaxID=1561947 RepID=UPI002549A1A0|nr:uncharacterized protein N7484_004894 [Penicillium longicatenatum]KAJ5651171.1 hypothetical protein N7484_004894 [Penicillium longicatenatum]
MPSVILIADEALTLDEYAHVWEAVCRCVRQGSTADLMGLFSSFVRPLDIKPFFSKAGLPWEGRTYVRTTLTINRAATGDELAARLPPSYSQKAVFIKNVAHSDRWYTTDASSVVEPRVFGPSPAHNPGQSPVIMARVGMGRLGYVGDCNAEEETDAVILAMCGLLG